MVDPRDQPKIAAFFKSAFGIDGQVDFLSGEAVRGLIQTHTISVMRLNDSQRGGFYIATFKPKAVHTSSAGADGSINKEKAF